MDDEPVFAGLYRGEVVSTKDPEGQSRVEVKVPALNGDGSLGWAMPCLPFLSRTLEVSVVGADETGWVTSTGETAEIKLRLPKPGDAVWVMFEHGSIDFPVWMGTWLASGGKS